MAYNLPYQKPYGMTEDQWKNIPSYAQTQISQSYKPPSTGSSAYSIGINKIADAVKQAGINTQGQNIIGNTGLNQKTTLEYKAPVAGIGGYMPEKQTSMVSASQPQFNFMDMIKGWGAEQIAKQISAIKQIYDKNRSSIKGAIPGVSQNADKARNANDQIYYTQQLPELRAAMEQAGMYRGGGLAEGTVQLSAARGQNLGNINTEEMNQLNQIQQALSGIDSEEQQKIIEANMGIQSEMGDRLMQAQQWMQEFGLKEDALDLDKIKTAYQQAIAEAGLTGYYKGTPTLQQQQMEGDNAYRQWQQTLQENNAAWEQSANNPQVKAQILANEITQLRMQYLPQELDLQIKQIEQDIQAGRVDMNEARARISQIAEQSKLNRDKFKFEQDTTNNELIDAKQKNAVASHRSIIDQYYATQDENGNKSVDRIRVANYLKDLYGKDKVNNKAIVDYLASLYGISAADLQ